MRIETVPPFRTEADIRALEAALDTANELIDKIKTVKELMRELDGMTQNLDVKLNIKFGN